MPSEKKWAEQYNLFRATRRDFLRFGTTAATAAGLFAVMNRGQLVEAATDSVLHKVGTGGAAVKELGYLDGWLGTSKIVGPIERISEVDIGFNKAARGLLGPDAKEQVMRFVGKYPLSKGIVDVKSQMAGESFCDGPIAKEKLPIPDPQRMSKHIKDTAMFLRADVVGIGLLPEFAVYTEKAPSRREIYKGNTTGTPINLRHKYAIGILIDQNIETSLGSTGYDGISSAQSMMAYGTSGFIACQLAAYIRNLGYPARAHWCDNYQLILPPVLIACGLGEMSRAGESVLHPVLGYRFKAAVVTTDLPLEPDGPVDFGLRDFCSKCMKCAENCPAQAISLDKDQKEYNGYLKWVGDANKCTVFRTTNREGSACGRCMKVCPWNNKETSWYHSLGTWAASRSGIASGLLKDIDDMFGYGTEVLEDYRWWLEWPELYK